MDNAEINSIVKIVGLKYGKKYLTDADMATLRYGKIMIMADQDVVRVLSFLIFFFEFLPKLF